MDLRPVIAAFRSTWSENHALQVARGFLAECGWELESGDGTIRVPPDAELLIYSAAVVISEHGFGEIGQAVVYLGVERSLPNVYPVHGVLRLYLNATGEMITEDRYSPAEWLAGRA